MLCLIRMDVLNLVINGIPSIQNPVDALLNSYGCFKPCYKWNTFNTKVAKLRKAHKG